MKSSWVVITLLLTVTGLAKAVPPQNPEQVNAMIEELKSLHQQGVELHRDYDSEDPAQRKACQAEHAGLGAQATELRNRAAKLPEYEDDGQKLAQEHVFRKHREASGPNSRRDQYARQPRDEHARVDRVSRERG